MKEKIEMLRIELEAKIDKLQEEARSITLQDKEEQWKILGESIAYREMTERIGKLLK